jgi:hypothetical protein
MSYGIGQLSMSSPYSRWGCFDVAKWSAEPFNEWPWVRYLYESELGIVGESGSSATILDASVTKAITKAARSQATAGFDNASW